MRRTQLVIGIIGISITLAAEPVCRVIQSAVSKRHSQKTLDNWAVWRHDHPNWVPKSKKETLAALDFACAPIPTLDVAATEMIAAVDEPAVPEMKLELDDDSIEPLTTAAVAVPEASADEDAANAPTGGGYPFSAPYLYFTGTSHHHRKHHRPPPVDTPAPVPEPASLWLMLTGVCGMAWKLRRCAL